MANIQERRDKNNKLISFSIRVFRGRDENGKQLKPWTETFAVEPGWTEKTARKKAEARAAVFEKECKDGSASDSRQKFSAYCDYYIKHKEELGAKHSTIVWYKSLTEKIYPEIGHIKLKDIQVKDLNELYSKLSQSTIRPTTARARVDLRVILKEQRLTMAAVAKLAGLSENTVSLAVNGKKCSVKTASAISSALGLKMDKTFLVLNENKRLSSKTVSGYHRLISAVLEQAVKEQRISKNVAAFADIPKTDRQEKESFDEDEIDAILTALNKEPLKWRVIVHLLLISGARRGEVLGLKWSAVDFFGSRIHICNNVLYTPDRGVYQDKPKTASSDRWVALPVETMGLLREWQAHEGNIDMPQQREDDRGLLFTQADGRPMCPDSVTTYLNRFSKKYGLAHINPHKFRHTMASMLFFNHVDPVSVSKRLGHKQVSTTTDIYAHAIAKADNNNAEILAAAYLKNG